MILCSGLFPLSSFCIILSKHKRSLGEEVSFHDKRKLKKRKGLHTDI